MKHTLDQKEKYALLKIEESNLTAGVAPSLKTLFVELHSKGLRNIVLDMSEVRYVDSSGLSAILMGNRNCDELEGQLVLAAINPHVEKLIHMSQLDKVLNILPTVEEAVDDVIMAELAAELEAEEDDE